MSQLTFSDLAYEHKKKVTRKERFFNEMDKVLPWKRLLEPLRKRSLQAARGRSPIPVETLLRIYFITAVVRLIGLENSAMLNITILLENLRELASEELQGKLVIQQWKTAYTTWSRCVAQAKVSLDRVPDETTLCKFRHYLERTGLFIANGMAS